mgnify:CR=1 FL=1
MSKKILVTGAAGFIGFHLCKALCSKGYDVIGIDNLNDYYSIQLKLDRLDELRKAGNFVFQTTSICDKDSLDDLFQLHSFDYVVNLAAQAGVRFSIDKPYKYIDSNLIGFINVLEACRQFPVKHLIFASSSSVYGANVEIPFSTYHSTDHPVSLYGATKKANEVMAHSYASLYHLPVTGLRFFTVYGPWGRPDMAYFKFLNAIMKGETIKVFGQGKMKRDFTYIDDIVEGICLLLTKIPAGSAIHKNTNYTPNESAAPYQLYNIGNNKPVELLYFIELLERLSGKTVKKDFLPMQPGEVIETYADISDLEKAIGFKPHTNIEDGLGKFVKWYKQYYHIS